MSKPEYAPKLETADDVRNAVQGIWEEIIEAKHAMHFLLNEVEEDWTRSVDRKDEAHIQDAKSARSWLASTITTRVDETEDRLSYLINYLPEGGSRHA